MHQDAKYQIRPPSRLKDVRALATWLNRGSKFLQLAICWRTKKVHSDEPGMKGESPHLIANNIASSHSLIAGCCQLLQMFASLLMSAMFFAVLRNFQQIYIASRHKRVWRWKRFQSTSSWREGRRKDSKSSWLETCTEFGSYDHMG